MLNMVLRVSFCILVIFYANLDASKLSPRTLTAKTDIKTSAYKAIPRILEYVAIIKSNESVFDQQDVDRSKTIKANLYNILASLCRLVDDFYSYSSSIEIVRKIREAKSMDGSPYFSSENSYQYDVFGLAFNLLNICYHLKKLFSLRKIDKVDQQQKLLKELDEYEFESEYGTTSEFVVADENQNSDSEPNVVSNSQNHIENQKPETTEVEISTVEKPLESDECCECSTNTNDVAGSKILKHLFVYVLPAIETVCAFLSTCQLTRDPIKKVNILYCLKVLQLVIRLISGVVIEKCDSQCRLWPYALVCVLLAINVIWDAKSCLANTLHLHSLPNIADEARNLGWKELDKLPILYSKIKIEENCCLCSEEMDKVSHVALCTKCGNTTCLICVRKQYALCSTNEKLTQQELNLIASADAKISAEADALDAGVTFYGINNKLEIDVKREILLTKEKDAKNLRYTNIKERCVLTPEEYDASGKRDKKRTDLTCAMCRGVISTVNFFTVKKLKELIEDAKKADKAKSI